MKTFNYYKSLVLTFFSVLITLTTLANDTLSVMFYNIYRYPSANPQQREVLLNDVLKFNKPDLLMVCELESEEGADRILNHSFRHNDAVFQRAEFVFNQSADDDTLQQMLYYNTEKFTLIAQQVYPTTVRDINRYTLLLNTTDRDKDSVIFELFVTHLKSSTGTANANMRLGMVDTMVQVLATIPTTHHVLFAGDMNFYRASELAYQHIIDTNRQHVLIDPMGYVPGTWQDNANYAAMHTQATRTSAAGFGLYGGTGGMDDRFDFIFLSKHLNQDTLEQVYFLPNSYEAVGNNGNCLNKAVKDTTCSGIYSQELRDDLHDMSDHLPVALKLITNKKIGPLEHVDTGTSITHLFNNKGQLELIGSNIIAHSLTLKYDVIALPDAIGSLLITNAMGQHALSLMLSHKGVKYLDVQDWKPGVYYISLNGQLRLKFIKI